MTTVIPDGAWAVYFPLGAPMAHSRNLFPTFVFTAVTLAVTLGVSMGGWAIWRMAFATGTVLASHLQVHAHIQLVGFAGLFILGVALQAVPRIFGVAPPSRPVLLAVLFGVGGGALLRAIGQPLAPWAIGRLLSLLSGALELAGVFAFAGWALPVFARRSAAADPLSLHILLGTVWAVAAGALSAAQAAFLAGHAESEIPAALLEPFYAIAVYGFVLSFVFGFASRMVPAFLGLPRPSARSARIAALLQGAGVLLLAAAWIPGPTATVSRALTLAGTLLLAAAIFLFLAASRILAPSVGAPGSRALRAPFVFLGVFAALSTSACLGELFGASVHKFIWDGARHVYTIGFLTLLILAMSLRVVPAFTGRALARPREAQLALVLVGAAAAARAMQIPVALGWGGLPLYRLVGTTGIVATAGLLLWAHVLVATLRPRAARTAAAPAVSPLALPARTS
jgi:hypothetical protein